MVPSQIDAPELTSGGEQMSRSIVPCVLSYCFEHVGKLNPVNPFAPVLQQISESMSILEVNQMIEVYS